MTVSPVGALWQGEPYARSAAVLTFAMHGTPVPQGSKSFKGTTSTGRAILVESSKALKPWRALVQAQIQTAMTTVGASFPLLGPLAIDLVFTMPKPRSAPVRRITYPIVKPDLDKLVRAVLDAGTYAGLWGDDSQVVDVHAFKVYPAETPRSLRTPGLLASIHTIGEQAAPAPAQLTLT